MNVSKRTFNSSRNQNSRASIFVRHFLFFQRFCQSFSRVQLSAVPLSNKVSFEPNIIQNDKIAPPAIVHTIKADCHRNFSISRIGFPQNINAYEKSRPIHVMSPRDFVTASVLQRAYVYMCVRRSELPLTNATAASFRPMEKRLPAWSK